MWKHIIAESKAPSKRTKLSVPLYSERDNPLPDLVNDVIEHIFTFLPIKEAIEASTISTWFKRSWTQNRKLMFPLQSHRTTQNLTAVVDHIFNSHQGSVIQCFQLHMSHVGSKEMIEKWLKICIQKGIEELDLKFFQHGFVLVPELLQIPTLKILKLSYVQFGVPTVINGWQNLHTVILRNMELHEEQLENVMLYGKMIEYLDLGSCRKIKCVRIFASDHKKFTTLKITTCPDVEKIEIDAPTLRHIHYIGFVIKLEFTQLVPSLSEAKFIFLRSRNYLRIHFLQNLVNHLQNVRVLTTSAQFQEVLSNRFRDSVFQELQLCFSNIKELHIIMNGANFCNPYDIIVFLKNCPSLEMLFIDLNDYHFECGTYWEVYQMPILEALNHYFDRLRVIKLIGFKFLESELQLLELLLKRSKFLETLILITPENVGIKKFEPLLPKYRDLIHSWKASPSAKVGLFEHSNDKSGIHPSHKKTGTTTKAAFYCDYGCVSLNV